VSAAKDSRPVSHAASCAHLGVYSLAREHVSNEFIGTTSGHDVLGGVHAGREHGHCRGDFLARAPVPVYLPSWLPAHPRLYSDLSFFSQTEYNYGPRVSGYRVGLYDNPRKDHASELFYMGGSGYPAGSRVPIGPYVLTTNDTRPVLLRKGQWAYIYPNIEGNDGPSIFWWQKHSLYHFGRQLPDQVLIRIARSVVRVH
jgi:hypothetical protein